MEEFGGVYKIIADGPYCDLYFEDGTKKTESKTLKKVIELNPDLFLRLNRKVAVNIGFIKDISESQVILKNNQSFEFSRRRKPILNMKKLALLFIFSTISLISFSQIKEPENKVLTVKKVVKVGAKFYIEESTTTTNYKELTSDLLLETERDSQDELNDKAEELRAIELSKQKKSERQERNKLLKDAISKGFELEIKTLEEKERVEKIKSKLGIKK